MENTTPAPAVFAEHDWVPSAERRRLRASKTLIYGTVSLGLLLYTAGIVRGFPRGEGLWLTLLGLAVLVLGAAVAFPIATYRTHSPTIPAGSRVFHASRVAWPVGGHIRLEVSRCRQKAFVRGGFHVTRSKLIYFFPQRPTARHIQAQHFGGGRGDVRYLYELQLTAPISRLYAAGPAMGSPEDLSAQIITVATLPQSRRFRSE